MNETNDWVLTFTFDLDPDAATMDHWAAVLDELDGSVAHIPGHGIDVTVWADGYVDMLDAAFKTAHEVSALIGAQPVGVDVVRENEYAQRAGTSSMPELMSAAEIADELGVSRQRVHQLRELPAFPAPLAELRGGAVWDANAVRVFGQGWERKPGRPRAGATP